MLKKFLLFVALCSSLFGCSLSEWKQEKTNARNMEKLLDLDVHKETLDNGLTIILVKNETIPTFSYYTLYRVGSKNERPGITGASHFLEHLMFKGAKKYGPGEFDYLIESNGGNNNAYTSHDLTVYYENLPLAALETIADLEADRMMNLLLEEGPFIKEKEVVLEERKMRYENSPEGQLFLAITSSIFKKTPYEESVIGSIKDIKNVTRDEIKAYFEKYYAPNNAVIVISGDININSTMRILRNKYAHLPPSPKLDKLTDDFINTEYKVKKTQGQEFHLHGQAPYPLFAFAYKSVRINDQNAIATDLLASILGDGSSSYFQQNLVENQAPTLSSLNVFNYTLAHAGVFAVMGQFLPKTSIKQFQKTFTQQTQRVCEKALTQRALDKAKNNYLVSFFRNLEKNSGIAQTLGLNEVFKGDYMFYKKDVASVNDTTLADVKRVCRQVFSQRPLYFTVWNQNSKSKGQK